MCMQASITNLLGRAHASLSWPAAEVVLLLLCGKHEAKNEAYVSKLY